MVHALRRTRAAVAVAAALALAGCAAGVSGNARLAQTEASGDGVLRIGMLLDNVGGQAYLNEAQRAAVQLAVQQANAVGGHKGRPIEFIAPTPSTDTAAAARRLVDAKADVVIGPTDSSHAPAAIDVLDKAKTVLISPANLDDALSAYPSGGYYFRTAPTESAEGAALVALAKAGEASSVAVLREKGSYGSAVGGATSAAAKAAGLAEKGSGEFTGHDARAAAASALAAGADAVIVVARDDPQAVLAQVHDGGVPGSKIILSDALVAPYGTGLAGSALDGARGLVPGAFPNASFQSDMLKQAPGLADMTFAAEAYDAAALAILAAADAQDDGGPSIASHLISVSGGAIAPSGQSTSAQRTKCTGLANCLSLEAKGTHVDYDGQSGPIAFDANGDITTANFTVFKYGAGNTARPAGNQSVAR
ncbi:ABC transporter substrate-binding protein [Sinomonas sp. ASV322]|uniref:ABC transporter substrate-binding protein n=1 Tax=Sinomonas sp. ASV322 TaxID=3041920 RepID=UPI0027DB4BE8|nr:ABC transporter substrate-binding protein [Sinomonas sp. ASV322]MDQ4503196.1 ABC transporter substrate-binding protein [Sinomonas sp. ASV322]